MVEETRAHLLGLLALEKSGVDVGDNTARRDGRLAHVLVELFIVAHSQADVAGHDAVLFVVLGGVTGQLKELSGQVLKDGCHIHGCTTSDTLGEATLAQIAAQASNGES